MKYLLLWALIGLSVTTHAQTPETANTTPWQWDASWISPVTNTPQAYGIYLFRKQFSLLNYSGPFIIHLSADNYYRLYVNGRFAGMGPARSDLANWYYETMDISPYLKYGDNSPAIEVINYGPARPQGQFTKGTALPVQR